MRPRRPVLVVGLLVLVAALGAFGWSVYDLILRPPVDPGAAGRSVAALQERWRNGHDTTPDPLSTQAVALLTIPALGTTPWPVVVGADPASLTQGVGWYPGTAAPGELGTFAVAGHAGVAGPFAGLSRLAPGDDILIETGTRRFTYRVDADPGVATVGRSDTWVIQPVPGRPEEKPTVATLTLTTAQGLIGSDSRTVAFATLVDASEKR